MSRKESFYELKENLNIKIMFCKGTSVNMADVPFGFKVNLTKKKGRCNYGMETK